MGTRSTASRRRAVRFGSYFSSPKRTTAQREHKAGAPSPSLLLPPLCFLSLVYASLATRWQVAAFQAPVGKISVDYAAVRSASSLLGEGTCVHYCLSASVVCDGDLLIFISGR